uniref:Uncharacterized protein n=1 Tax=Romanomermis culicivorax TaxID=13658 RepID=A0A915HZY9_ROMCU
MPEALKVGSHGDILPNIYPTHMSRHIRDIHMLSKIVRKNRKSNMMKEGSANKKDKAWCRGNNYQKYVNEARPEGYNRHKWDGC